MSLVDYDASSSEGEEEIGEDDEEREKKRVESGDPPFAPPPPPPPSQDEYSVASRFLFFLLSYLPLLSAQSDAYNCDFTSFIPFFRRILFHT